ncbi:phospholipase D family protein [Desulfosarcina sp.]|uniref:phospholipase D family protein n=1 Tax=Desulfosarcina sp. TaxID=2027861 RepID=UPI00356A54EB
MTTRTFFKISVLLAFSGLVAGCATVSFEQPKSYSTAISDYNDTALGEYAATVAAHARGGSGFYPLDQGMDALGMRLHLAETAQKSIDLQYFLIKNDTAGAVMANALLKAADRGVRVRFLLDDVFTTVPDDSFLLINQHPNIDIRIFNPVSRRGIYALNFIAQFNRANRRMHNKSFTVDNSISIVGGRNIADEYFQLKTDSVFVDFDILAVGPIAVDISASFDEYWNHSRAVPIDQFIEDPKKEDLETVRAEIQEDLDAVYDTVYEKALDSQLLKDLMSERQPLFSGQVRLLADSPDKLINQINATHMRLAMELREVILSAEKEILLISPYYVPGDRGVQLLRDLVAKGVRVMILTNSLASTNHVPVHSAYARYRRDVIEAGAELYEARANAARQLNLDQDGPETLTLHSKLFVIDRRKLFVGSLNLDPRSIELNAEMGLLIEAEPMVNEMTQDLAEGLATLTYRVRIDDQGRLEWHCRIDDQPVVETKEPLTGGWRRFKAWLMKIAPERQL